MTTVEKRAKAMCDNARNNNGQVSFAVIWKKSPTWGMCPSVIYRGEKVGYASGCGYDKASAAIAEAVRFLGATPEEVSSIWQSSGMGVREVIRRLSAIGWELTCDYEGRTEDGYTVKRITP